MKATSFQGPLKHRKITTFSTNLIVSLIENQIFSLIAFYWSMAIKETFFTHNLRPAAPPYSVLLRHFLINTFVDETRLDRKKEKKVVL